MSPKLSNLLNRSSVKLTGKNFDSHRKVFKNTLRRKFVGAVDNKFLFILSPPFCGSTLLNQVISTSQFVSVNNEVDTREGQTLPEVRKMMFDHHQRWDENLVLDWPFIKKIWLKYWDRTKPILLEKSPPNIVRAAKLQEHFAPSYFIIFHRNPYAHVESLINRKNPDLEEAARFSIRCLQHQKRNLENLKNHIHISYEQLTNAPESVVNQLQEMLPELTDINIEQNFTAHNFKKEKAMKITNLNQEKIGKLNPDQMERINQIFEPHGELLQFFDYDLVETNTNSNSG